MKALIKVLLISTALICNYHATAERLRAYFAYNTFLLPGSGPYIETYLQFDASSLAFIETSNHEFQATVEILLVFKQDNKIKEFSKYELKSPAIKDLTNISFSFIDQQRFLLQNGEYLLEIMLIDINQANDTLNHSEEVFIDIDQEGIMVSSVQLVERIKPSETPGPLTKSGYEIYPYVDYFYPSDMNTISFYTEIYNSSTLLGDGTNFLLVSSIEAFETNKVLAEFNRFKRETAKPVNVLINNFDISRLPSGNYYLVVSVKDRNNETLASNRVFFQRSNPDLKLSLENFQHVSIANSFAEQITDPDSLAYFIKALGPISAFSEREFAINLVATKDIRNLQQYFYNFWLQRAPSNPENEWKQYYIEMCKADAFFKTRVKRGFETDRGRVYLQYGPPNSINQSYDEPSAFPYEIWHYYIANGQRDKRFVFFSRDFATNDFELLHSDVIGELANHRWHLMLHNRNNDAWDIDTENAPDHWGGKSRDFFDRPR